MNAKLKLLLLSAAVLVIVTAVFVERAGDQQGLSGAQVTTLKPVSVQGKNVRYAMTLKAPDKATGVSVMNVKPGDNVLIEVTNQGGPDAQFEVIGLSRSTTLGGDKSMLQFAAPQPGRYPIIMTSNSMNTRAEGTFTQKADAEVGAVVVGD